ncbi:UDP-N-acetylmuramyl pentapeptide synthase [Intrasporangium chromatireducens Q5-1]|uniref:UDP-N-acetylmuramoyl-tripeptide--D-alanyl-D-alanine ligase n=1 Tax=Intrasporangium chromatireducens Q5-1 TaxID=584657 RepID=W9GLV1_9MICO|nr:UDP-N-acetylmuramoyl-tripeptide--D-alanyl-D-alanine ligase [Intrasporangium chromatireducens]EWT05818.1 UDP-N-acetylmuramyl pentapeptide synthase [Intrasporangium chromatireducens Q5-1]
MIPLSLTRVAELTGGVLHGAHAAELVIDGPVVTDSRECGPGGLYVARVGEHADGHAFVPDAASRGAVAALTSRVVSGLPCVVVDDVQLAFGRLARGVVDAAPDLAVIGITGSSGKTTTKDLLASVLATAGETVAPVNSLNGEVGVPLTVCRITAATRHLVVEMGARGMGHLRYLTQIAPPRIGIVLNVGSAHLGEFGSRENIARAKAELPQALPPDGLAILNADDPLVTAMAEGLAARVCLVGTSERAEVRAEDVVLDDSGRAAYTLVAPQGRASVRLALVGPHHVANSLAVAAAALELGLPLDTVAAALGAARAVSRWRMEVTHRPDGVTVVNDAYNANPESMRAALDALAAMETSGRRWAVVGEMLELGDSSADEHAQIGRYAAQLGIDRLVAVGDGARPVGAPEWVRDTDAAYDLLRVELAPGDVVLFKSSRDSGLRWLGERVAGPPGPAGAAGSAVSPGAADAAEVSQ